MGFRRRRPTPKWRHPVKLGIAQGLRKVSSGKAYDVAPLSWGGILETLRGGATIDVQGASGALDYDPITEETSAEIQVWVIGSDATVQPAQ
jgi:hypothetical protein